MQFSFIFVVILYFTDCNGLLGLPEPRYTGGASISCRDEGNKPVDWWLLYKLPRHLRDSNTRHPPSYLFTKSLAGGEWSESKFSIATSSSALGNTLAPLYRKTYLQYMAAIVYNDELDLNSSHITDAGYAKGVLMADSIGAAWLTHTLPAFPDMQVPYYYFPRRAIIRGQMFFCLTTQPRSADVIASQLRYNAPLITYSHVADSMMKKVPYMMKLIANQTFVSNPLSTGMIQTRKGEIFHILAKQSEDDIYRLLQNFVKDSIMVYSYAQQPHQNREGICETENTTLHHIINVMYSTPQNNYSMAVFQDNSMWAISTAEHDRHRHWICFGGAPRAEPFIYRKSLLVCTDNVNLWKLFDRSIVNIFRCDNVHFSKKLK